MGPRAVSSYLPRLTKKVFEKYGFASAAVFTEWGSIVGPEVAAYTAPERLKWPRLPDGHNGDVGDAARNRPGATLVLRVDGPRAIELQHKSRQLLEQVNAYYGYRAVAELRFVQGPIASPAGKLHAVARPSAAGSGTQIPPQVAGIAADGLRSALAKLASHVAQSRST